MRSARTARTAKNFELLYFPKSIKEEIRNKFKLIY